MCLRHVDVCYDNIVIIFSLVSTMAEEERTCYIGNLPQDITQDILEELFVQVVSFFSVFVY